MKCPYRVKKTIKTEPMPSNYLTIEDPIIKTTESTDFADCYEQACPCFDSEKRRCNYGK